VNEKAPPTGKSFYFRAAQNFVFLFVKMLIMILLIDVLSNVISIVGCFVGVFEIIVLPSKLTSVPRARDRRQAADAGQVGEARYHHRLAAAHVSVLRRRRVQHHGAC